MSVSLAEFLSRKGAVGLLVVLVERGKSYSEIESEIDATTDTVSKRRDEALELGLIELKPAKRETRTLKEHHLTEFGERITEKLSREGVVTNYMAMRTHQTKVEDGKDAVIDWVRENKDELDAHAADTRTTFIDRTSDEDQDEPEEADNFDTESGNDDSSKVQHELPDGDLEDFDEDIRGS